MDFDKIMKTLFSFPDTLEGDKLFDKIYDWVCKENSRRQTRACHERMKKIWP